MLLDDRRGSTRRQRRTRTPRRRGGRGHAHAVARELPPRAGGEAEAEVELPPAPAAALGREAIDELLLDLLGSDPSVGALAEPIFPPGAIPSEEEVVPRTSRPEPSRSPRRLPARRGHRGFAIPGSVQNVLAARIDRLEERERHVAPGRLGDAVPVPGAVLRRWRVFRAKSSPDARGPRPGGVPARAALYPQAEYAFKHLLTQEVARVTALREATARHAADSRAPSKRSEPRSSTSRPGLLAYHWEAAGGGDSRALARARAARSIGLDDSGEARRHWDRVWTLVETAPTATRRAAADRRARALLRLGFRQGRSRRGCS